MGSSVHGTPFDRRSLTASATRWPANGSGSMGSLRARARPCRRAVGAGPAGRAEGCGRRACPASSPGPAEPRPPAPVRRSVGRLGAAARAAALAVLALAALALAVPERAQAQTEYEVAADWVLKPDAVGAGEKFRLIFVTSTTRAGTSTDIADYNTRVQNAAAVGHTAIRNYAADFTAWVSTETVNVRTNTETRSTDTDVPIYWVHTTKTRGAVATNYADLYDGAWANSSSGRTQAGTAQSFFNRHMWFGSNPDGTTHATGFMGASPSVSRLQISSGNFSVGLNSRSDSNRLIAISPIFEVAAAAANAAPAFAASTATRTLDESIGDTATASATNIGAPVAATDGDGDTLTYTLEGTDAASFDVDSGTGQLKTKAGVLYDHEAKSSYSVTVKADDGNGGTDTIDVTITLNDQDEAPLAVATPTVTAASATSLAVSWTAPGNTGRPAIASYDVQYRAGTTGFWTAGPLDVTGTSTTITGLTASTSYQVRVRATNDDGDGEYSATPGSATTNAPPADITAPRVTSIERQDPSSSPTNANSLTWRVTFDEAVSNVGTADFSVTGTTATLAVTGSGTTYDVTASGGNLPSLDATVTLAFASGQDIEDAAGNALTNTTPTGTNENSYRVDNTAPTVMIGGVPDPSSAPFTATFTFSEDVTGFVVGDIGLGNATASNFTSTTDRVYTALITPAATGTVTVDVAVDVAEDEAGNGNTAANRARSTYTAPTVTCAPDLAGRTQIWTAEMTVGTSGTSLGYAGWRTPVQGALSDTDFEIDGVTYTINQISHTDGSDTLTLGVVNPPVIGGAFDDLTLHVCDVPLEFSDAAPSIGSVQSTFVWFATGLDFSMVTTRTLYISMAAAAANTAPEFAAATATRSVAENTAADRDIGAPVGATDDDGDTLEYSLNGTDASSFSIDASTGQLKTGAALDFETKSSYSVTVGVSDSKDSSGNADTVVDDTIDVTITVTNEEEAGRVALSSNRPVVGIALTARLSDPDGTPSGVTWRWSSSATAGGTFRNISGATSASYKPVADDVGDYLRATARYTDPEASGKRASATTAGSVTSRVRELTLEDRLPSGDCRDLNEYPNCGIGLSIDQRAGGYSDGGAIQSAGDGDLWTVVLYRAQSYLIEVKGAGDPGGDDGGTLPDPWVEIYELTYDTGTRRFDPTLRASNDNVNATNKNAGVVYTYPPGTTPQTPIGIRVRGANGATGSYTVSVKGLEGLALTETADCAGDQTTACTIEVGGTVRGTVSSTTDFDAWAVPLEEGRKYRFDAQGVDSGGGTLPDPFMRLNEVAGGTFSSIQSNSDGGTGKDARIQRTLLAGQGDTYYVRVSGTPAGTYTLTVTDVTPQTQTQQEAPPAPPAPPAAPLTAEFRNVPAEHDGSSAFDLELHFSEAPKGLSYRTLRGNAFFDVSNGTVTKAKRLVRKDNSGWRVTVEPDGNDDVIIGFLGALPTQDCAAAAVVCTADGTRLSVGAATFVPGPASFSVADATVQEGPNATLDFVVTLSRARHEATTVDYATSDGTATAGADYTADSGTLSFASGETGKTVSVEVLDDSHDEGSETLTFTLSNPVPSATAKLGDATATGTINNSDPMPQAWIARFGRTVAEQVVDAVQSRMAASRTPGVEVSLAGQRIGGGPAAETDEAREAEAGFRSLAEWVRGEEDGETATGLRSRAVTGRDFLIGSSFALTGGSRERGFASLWGRGAISSFDGREGELTLDGEVQSAMLGADWALGATTAGVMVSHSRGEGGYRSPDGGGDVESTLTGLYPYGHHAVSDRLSLWGVAGYGKGSLTLTPEGQAPMEDGHGT